MSAKVYFADLKADAKRNLLDKISDICKNLDLKSVIKPRDLVAIKIHFGEKGNASFVRPVLVQRFVEEIKASGGKPFLTDANTLYVGSRGEAVTHLTTAVENGFAFSVVKAPLVIADGLRGNTSIKVPVNGEHIKEAAIGAEIVNADFLFSLAHFKGHELSGFGGAIKNVGMGSASREGKLAQHSNVSPLVKENKCVGCESCVPWCRSGSISITSEGKASINPETCIGCGECILTCPEGAIQIQWNEVVPVFLKKMVEYTAAVMKGKEKKSVFFNVITQVSSACDCYPYNDTPIVGDIGIVASTDIVAIDQASVDLVNREAGNPESLLKGEFLAAGADKFKGLYPNVEWGIQLEYAEKIGLGSRKYDLVKV